MNSIRLICPKCNGAVENASKDDILQHDTKECPDCKEKGLDCEISLDGFDGLWKVSNEVKCVRCETSEFFGDKEKQGYSLCSYSTVKEGAKRPELEYIILRRVNDDGVKTNVLRYVGADAQRLIDDLTAAINRGDKQDTQLLDSLIDAKTYSLVVYRTEIELATKRKELRAKEKAEAKEKKESASKLSYFVTARNSAERRPAFLANNGGVLSVVINIGYAYAFRTEEQAQEALAKAKDSFGTAYTDYSIEPISSSLVRSVVRRNR